MIMQHFDHLAGRDPPSGAFRRHTGQLGPQRLKSRDLLDDIGQMTFGDGIGLRAGAIRMIRKIKQRADRVEVEPELARMTDEGEPAQRRLIVQPTVAGGAAGSGRSPTCS